MLLRSLRRAAALSHSLNLEQKLQKATTVANPFISRTISNSAIVHKGMMAAQYKPTSAPGSSGSANFFQKPTGSHHAHHRPKVAGDIVGNSGGDSGVGFRFLTTRRRIEADVQNHKPKITEPKESVEFVEMNVPIRDEDGKIIHVPTFVVTPSNWKGTCLYVLGSGHLEGGETHITELIARKMAVGLRRRMIVPIPTSQRYPIPYRDVAQVCRFFVESGFGIDASQLMIAGYSGGASAALHATIQEINRGIQIQALLLISPFLCYARRIIDKREEFRVEDPTLPRPFINAAINHYLGNDDTHDPYNPIISPLLYTVEDLKEMRLPPTIITFGNKDGVLGDAKLFAEKLKRAGGTTVELEYEGQNHGHWWHSDRSHETTYGVTKQVLKDKQSRVYTDDGDVLIDVTRESNGSTLIARRRSRP